MCRANAAAETSTARSREALGIRGVRAVQPPVADRERTTIASRRSERSGRTRLGGLRRAGAIPQLFGLCADCAQPPESGTATTQSGETRWLQITPADGEPLI